MTHYIFMKIPDKQTPNITSWVVMKDGEIVQYYHSRDSVKYTAIGNHFNAQGISWEAVLASKNRIMGLDREEG